MAVYKRGKVWYYDFVFHGDRFNKSTDCRSKRAAEEIERTLRTNLALGQYGLAPPKITPVFQAFVEGKFLDHIRVQHQKKPRTIQYYEEKTRRLVAFEPLATARLREIAADTDLIERYTQHRAKTVSISSLNRERGALRHILRKAQEWGQLERVPKIPILPGEEGRDFVVSYTLEAKYLELAPQPLKDCALLLLDTGLRPSECVSREWTDIHLEPAHGAQFGYVAVAEGKTKNAKRNIPLTEQAGRMLEWRRMFYPEARWVFPGQRKGQHLTIWGLDNLHAELRRDTLDEDGDPVFPETFVLYSLRHTFGTRLGESGASPYTIMTLMGHSSITISQKYVHPTPEHVERAMAQKEIMDRQLRGENVQQVPADFTTRDFKEP